MSPCPTVHDFIAEELVDVMLVLLVIFMVVTPLLRQQLPIELPRAERSEATGQAAR